MRISQGWREERGESEGCWGEEERVVVREMKVQTGGRAGWGREVLRKEGEKRVLPSPPLPSPKKKAKIR